MLTLIRHRLLHTLPVNKLVPATSCLWALYKSGVYDYDNDMVGVFAEW